MSNPLTCTGDPFSGARPAASAPAGEVPKSAADLPMLEVFVDYRSVSALADDWDAFVAQLEAPVYMTFDWAKTWWEFYGAGRQLRILLFRDADGLAGVLPMYLEDFGRGPWKTRVARLVGANIPPTVFNPPVRPAAARRVLALALRHLLREDGCDLVCLGPVSERWPGHAALEGSLEAKLAENSIGFVRHVPRDVQTWFQLPATFEEYVSGLSHSERKGRMKRIRQIERSHQLSTDIVSDPGLVQSEFEAFAGLHAAQWQAVGKPGHFGSWPNGHAYNRAQVAAQAGRGRVRFYRMLADGRVVSSRYTYLLGTTLYSELPAREVGDPWDKLGIGGVSLVKFNEAAIQSGVKAVDSGLGTYEHKAQLGGDRVPVGTWHIGGGGIHGIKARLFLLVSRAVGLACHKLWYRRILPRMPSGFRRTQAMWWLRFDA